MTFAEQDQVLRGYAGRLGYRLRKRPRYQTWGVYRLAPPFPYRVAYGFYDEVLCFFNGVEEGRRRPGEI